MAKTASLHIRVDEQSKAQAERVYKRLGMSVSEAVNIFLHKSILVGGIPFDVRYDTPNAETLAAFQEVEEMEKNPSLGKAYTSVSEMMEDLLK